MARKSYWQSFQRERISRRRLLGAAGVGAAGLAVAAACGGGGDDGGGGGATPDEGEITKDGILRYSFSITMPTLDLFGSTADTPNIAFAYTIFDHLFYVPLDTQVRVLQLAENEEIPDEDGLEHVFTLQESYFHDKAPVNGRLVEANDVKASYDAYMADTIAAGTASLRELIASIEAPDVSTVKITATKPFAWFYHPGGIGGPRNSNIIPAEILDQEGYGVSFDTSRDVIGSGRFMLTKNESFTRFEAARHPKWRIEGEPYLAGSESVYISETAQARATFRAGDLDYLLLANKGEADDLVADMGDKVNIASALSRTYSTLLLNLDKVEAFKDPDVRKAINLAIDRQALIQGVELDAEGGAPSGPVAPALTAFALPDDEMEEYFRHDPEEAEELLKKADFPFDKQLTLKFAAYATGEMSAMAQLLKEQLGDVGISVKLEEEDLTTVWWPKTLPGDFEMTVATFLPYDDPYKSIGFYTNDSVLGSADDPRGRNNMGFFDDDISAAFQDMNATLDAEALNDKVKEAVRLIMEKQAPMINLYSANTYTAYQYWYKGLADPKQGAFATFWGRSWIDTRLRGS